MSARREHPAVTAAEDQAVAAADDAARWVRERYERYAAEEALTTGRAPQLTDEKARAPAGPAAMVLEGVFRRFAAGEVSGCLPAVTALTAGLARAPGPRPAALVWLSWHPGLIMCPPCAEMLPDPSVEQDRRCDGCGYARAPGEPIMATTYVVAGDARQAASEGHPIPPLIASFGLCMPCSQASRSQAPRPGPG